jgi:hypothetical protein
MCDINFSGVKREIESIGEIQFIRIEYRHKEFTDNLILIKNMVEGILIDFIDSLNFMCV